MAITVRVFEHQKPRQDLVRDLRDSLGGCERAGVAAAALRAYLQAFPARVPQNEAA
ncbi:hypothetical protein [Ramlibacter sp.]|uniref:hypothetical protein n=1 Tax=Ramlibacter sp. TaxID=1917967 RepID=UPI002632E40E|nr:hypothetical protein [Ramlibacter sp.]